MTLSQSKVTFCHVRVEKPYSHNDEKHLLVSRISDEDIYGDEKKFSSERVWTQSILPDLPRFNLHFLSNMMVYGMQQVQEI
jgi:hypothetical protein